MTYLSTVARGATAAVLMLAAQPSFAADLIYGTGAVALGTTPYTQDFDTLASSGATSAVLPTGWVVSETGTNANGTYSVNNGSSTTGDVYSYGATGSADRALGTLRSGSLNPSFGAIFTNSTGNAITDLLISFTGEQWRNGNASVDTLGFQYSLTSTNIADAATSASWISLSDLNFVSPSNGTVGVLDGNSAINRALLSTTLSGLTIDAGQQFAFRWIDVDADSADDGLAIDNFSLTASGAVAAVPETATWGMMIAGFGMIGFALRRRGQVKTTVSVA